MVQWSMNLPKSLTSAFFSILFRLTGQISSNLHIFCWLSPNSRFAPNTPGTRGCNLRKSKSETTHLPPLLPSFIKNRVFPLPMDYSYHPHEKLAICYGYSPRFQLAPSVRSAWPAPQSAWGCPRPVILSWVLDSLDEHTVDGGNPAPVSRWFIHVYPIIIPLFIVFYSSQ